MITHAISRNKYRYSQQLRFHLFSIIELQLPIRAEKIQFDAAPDLIDASAEFRRQSGTAGAGAGAGLCRWFMSQDDVTRGSIMVTLPESLTAEVTRMPLNQSHCREQ